MKLNLSICLAAYNGEDFIREQIESIIPQLKDGDEFLIGDDGSTDRTLEIIREYESPILKIFEGRVGGVNHNYERLILRAKNVGIVLSDQDDVWLPNRLDLLREALKISKLVVTNGYVVDAALKPSGQSVFAFVGYRRGFFNNFIKNTYVGCCLAFHQNLIVSKLPFRNDLPAHDWYIGLLAEINGRISVIETPTFLYRRHGGNLSNTGQSSKNSLLRKIGIRCRLLNSILVALFQDAGKTWLS
jgi:glycosyltransferase involved in cell wall biosynthesis